MVFFDLDKINKLLDELKNLPKIREIRELKKRLTKEKQKLIIIPIPDPIPKPKSEKNKNHSNFMTGVWKYVKLLYDNYPQLREKYSIKQVFLMFFARRRGEDVDIDDVYWQNPSG
jgi:hypothetical protein